MHLVLFATQSTARGGKRLFLVRLMVYYYIINFILIYIRTYHKHQLNIHTLYACIITFTVYNILYTYTIYLYTHSYPYYTLYYIGYLHDTTEWAQYDATELVQSMGAGAQQALTGNVLIDVGTADSFLINGQLLPEVSK